MNGHAIIKKGPDMLAKLKMLKEVLRQMQCAMSEGDGDSESVGKEAMASLGDGDMKVAEAEAEEKPKMGEGFDDEKKDFMRHGKKLPTGGRGAAAVMASLGSKKPMGKKKHG